MLHVPSNMMSDKIYYLGHCTLGDYSNSALVRDSSHFMKFEARELNYTLGPLLPIHMIRHQGAYDLFSFSSGNLPNFTQFAYSHFVTSLLFDFKHEFAAISCRC
jgi:hypothetical protein